MFSFVFQSSIHGDEDVIPPSQQVTSNDEEVIPPSDAEEVESDGVDNSQQEKQSLISLEFDEGIPPSDANVIPSSDVKVKAWSPQLDIPKNLRWPVLHASRHSLRNHWPKFSLPDCSL